MTDAVISQELSDQIDSLIASAGIDADSGLVRRILETGIGLGMDGTSRLNLKITAAAVEEMRSAFQMFDPYQDVPMVTIFGSARTKPQDPLYLQAHAVAEELAQSGWMVVTGAGPGIMQAAAEGAGADMAIGVSIRLPFEEKPAEIFSMGARHVSMKYFFTRKLMLMKSSSGFICVPGGFGTLDEMFELLTLQQTGKAEPVPIVLLDQPGGTFWRGLQRYVETEMIPAGVISQYDLDRVLITDSVAEAEAEITGFWKNYHSLCWVGETLILRVKSQPSISELAELNREFAGLLLSGQIEATDPLDIEREDNDALSLPRLKMHVNQFKVGGLFQLIRAINRLDSAQDSSGS